ncbi:MAG TPA: tripartite tricarboxylate transporter substrate binding protein [Burkholderiales bacterium]|nr:tripartite tricarboxylate transporter substrate binding protein [Burkholderiales bacterium]
MFKPIAATACATLSFFAAQTASHVSAADYPSRPVRVIVPYAPGGATDIIARQLAIKLNEAWGQPVIVENRPGASGNIALELAARATPDGHTVLVGNVSTNAINETTFAKVLPIKPSRDLPGVTGLVEIPHLWLAHPSVPANSLKEMAEHIKKSGGKMSYASAGLGSYPHLDVANFLKANGVQMTHVPYKGGAGQIIPALIGGETQFTMLNMASTLQHVKANRIKALATTWPTRRPEVPEVPTVAEAGYPGMGTNAWQGLFAPVGLSKPVLEHLHASVVKIMNDAQMKDALAKQLMYPKLHKSPAEFSRFVDAEIKHWAKVVKENNIAVE